MRETQGPEEEPSEDEGEDEGEDESDDLHDLDGAYAYAGDAVHDAARRARARARSHWRRSAAYGSGAGGGNAYRAPGAAKFHVQRPYEPANGIEIGIGNGVSNPVTRAPSVGSSIYSTVPHRHVNALPVGEMRERGENYEVVAKRAARYKMPAAMVREVEVVPVVVPGQPNDAAKKVRHGGCE